MLRSVTVQTCVAGQTEEYVVDYTDAGSISAHLLNEKYLKLPIQIVKGDVIEVTPENQQLVERLNTAKREGMFQFNEIRNRMIQQTKESKGSSA